MSELHPPYSHGVGVFILRDGSILLTHRRNGEQPGVWEVVAGRIKTGESAENTAIREALEESGLVIEITKHIGQHIDHTHHFQAEMVLAKIVSGEAQNLDERHHFAIEWVPLDNLPEPLGSTTKKGLHILGYLLT